MRAWLAAAALAVAFALTAGSAMRNTSATFDEIMFASAGARGFSMGDYSLVTDHPRLATYLYGYPAWLSAAMRPGENGQWSQVTGYDYSRGFYFRVGNDPERIAFNTRVVAVILAALLVFATFALTRRHLGDGPALLAAALVASTPDVLAHAGIAYNDLPSALTIFVGAYALDAAVRKPTLVRAALAGLACALALGIKATGILLFPILVVLVVLEALSGRWRDAAWSRALKRTVGVFFLAGYATLVAIYLGDFALSEFMASIMHKVWHASGGHGNITVLLGERRAGGWWYFFPVAFLLKTSAALHVLLLIAAVGAWLALRGGLRPWLASPLRVPLIAGMLILAALIKSGLQIGLRHALPGVPFLCVLVAWGVSKVWERSGKPVRAVVVALVAWNAISVLRFYPHFLPYLAEYPRGGLPLYETLVDSNTDWGQGLLELRAFMRSRGIDQVYLSYFGSALPEGYGIRYHAMRSFYVLDGRPSSAEPPRYAAISATNLAGAYFKDDPFAKFRARTPFAVLANNIWVYELAPGETYSSK